MGIRNLSSSLILTSKMYGTRKRRPGAGEASAAKTLEQIRPLSEDDEIEMDDLPVRATAPEHLISDEKASEQSKRESTRSERRPKKQRSRERNPSQEDRSWDVEETKIEEADENDPNEDSESRPERFAMVEKKDRPVQEFRPSRDSRKTPRPRQNRSAETASRTKKPEPKKKGVLASILSFFTGDEPEKKEEESPRRGRNPNRRRRGRRRPNRNGENRNNRQDRDGGSNRRGGPSNKGRRSNSNGRRRRRPRSQSPDRGVSAE